MIRLESKRSDERRTLRHDWTAFLGEDTIASQTTTSSDVTIAASAVDTGDKSITFMVDGGTDGENATITQSIVTAAGDHETETFILPIAVEDLITLGEAKDYLRVSHSYEDAKIMQMIPRARRWVEDHTGLALVRRQFVERLRPSVGGVLRVTYGPLVSVDSVAYLDSAGSTAAFTPIAYPPSNMLIGTWPTIKQNEAFTVTYTAGDEVQNADDRLRGAMFALISGEYESGVAYPDDAVKSAENCCAYLKRMVA